MVVVVAKTIGVATAAATVATAAVIEVIEIPEARLAVTIAHLDIDQAIETVEMTDIDHFLHHLTGEVAMEDHHLVVAAGTTGVLHLRPCIGMDLTHLIVVVLLPVHQDL